MVGRIGLVSSMAGRKERAVLVTGRVMGWFWYVLGRQARKRHGLRSTVAGSMSGYPEGLLLWLEGEINYK